MTDHLQLIRAVQHELGIVVIANNFGPTTISKWNSPVSQLLFEDKNIKLLS